MENKRGPIYPIPTNRSLEDTRDTLSKYAPWFYKFVFSNGVVTEGYDKLTDIIHQTRAELLFPKLDEMLRGRWGGIRCLDIACHEGWFATQVALRGARDVLGIDIRKEHIKKANVIKRLGNLSKIKFKRGNLYEIKPDRHGGYDLTFFLGILYHLDNPLEALRILRSMTKSLCVIESQVARPADKLECLWGADTALRKGPGIAVVRSDKAHVEGERSVVLVPTLEALYEMLYAVGFDHLDLSVPSKSMYKQYLNFDRVLIFAQAVS